MGEARLLYFGRTLDDEEYAGGLLPVLVDVVVNFEFDHLASRTGQLHDVPVLNFFEYFAEHVENDFVLLLLAVECKFVIHKSGYENDLCLLAMNRNYFAF